VPSGNMIDRGQIHNPRFYVDRGKYLQIKGYRHENYFSDGNVFSTPSISTYNLSNSDIYRLTDLNPLTPVIINTRDRFEPIKFVVWCGSVDNYSILNNLQYVAFLGHNLRTAGASVKIDVLKNQNNVATSTFNLQNSGYVEGSDVEITQIINWGNDSLDSYSPLDGTTMVEIDTQSFTLDQVTAGEYDSGTYNLTQSGLDPWGLLITIEPAISGQPFNENVSLGAFSYGSYYEMPYSPDLTSTFSIKSEGVIKQKTIGGATVTNTLFTGPPDWPVDPANRNMMRPFSYNTNKILNKNEGRRVWDISFTALFDYDIFSPNPDLSASQASDDFYTVFLSKTLNGQLPFIFEYNTRTITSTDENDLGEDSPAFGDYGDVINAGEHIPHHFLISRLVDDTFSADQIAPGLYSMQFSIEETW